MYKRLFKDRNDENELKARKGVNSGNIQYDRIGLTGAYHDHEYVKIRPLPGASYEGVSLPHAGCTGNPSNCPLCGGGG